MNQTEQVKTVIGLDVHPYMFSAAALAGPDALHAETKWIVDRVELSQLERIMKQRTHPGEVIVMEAGSNSFAVAERLFAIGLHPIVLESQAVGKVGKAYCATDKTDAVKIARVYLSGLAHEVWIPDGRAAERRELFFAYRNAVKDSVRSRNRIWGLLSQQCVRRPKGLSLKSPTAIDKLLALRSWSAMQEFVLREAVETFQMAENRRQRVCSRIAEEVAGDPQILKMIRLLGVRDKVAFALAAFIGPVGRFATPRKMVAFFGLNPSDIETGITRGSARLSGYGRGDVRALLIQAAQSILRHGQGATHKWAIALKMRKGINIAVAALARKLVVSVWYLLKGFFTPLTEITAAIRIKIHKIASEIGKTRIRAMGYASNATFEREKLNIIMQTT